MVRGGKIHGKGAKGMVIDICPTDENTFCNRVDKEQIQSIDVYDMEKGMINQGAQVYDLICHQCNMDNVVAKEFYRENDKEKDFLNEIQSIQDLPLESSKTIIELQIGSNKYSKVYGFRITYINGNKAYYVLNMKCEYSLHAKMLERIDATTFEKLVSDILENLCTLQTKNIIHGDIKPDNIMFCNGKFTLIDWELAKNIQDFKTYLQNGSITTPPPFGARAYSSPLLYYLYYNTKFNLIKLFTMILESEIHAITQDELKQHIQLIQTNIDEIIEHDMSNKETIFESMKYTFDMFNFGFVLLKLLLLNKATGNIYKQYDKYMLFVKRLTHYNLVDTDLLMFYNPCDALREWRRLETIMKGAAQKKKKFILTSQTTIYNKRTYKVYTNNNARYIKLKNKQTNKFYYKKIK
jgi:serine/threonine protein kinase